MIRRDKINFEKFREKYLWGRLDIILILFELVLSVIFLLLSYLLSNIYIKGVGVGLIIAWVTSAIAHIVKMKKVKS
jgi:hypothetical protein